MENSRQGGTRFSLIAPCINSRNSLQKMFGTGLSSNAHSSYFFLLLQIGWVGLIFYIILHLGIFIEIWRFKRDKLQKTFTILLLSAFLLVGISLTTVIYTSFQWFVYILVGFWLRKREVNYIGNQVIYRR